MSDRAARQAGKDEQPMSEPDEAAITRLLGEHTIIKTGDFVTDLGKTTCLCGEHLFNAGGAPIEIADWHRAHVAAVLAAHMADREADAEALDAAAARIVELDYVIKRQHEMFQDVVTERDRLAVHEAKLEAERDAARLQVEALNIVVGDRLNTARIQGKAEGLREAADGLEGALGVSGKPQTLYDFRIWLRDRAARLTPDTEGETNE